MGSRKRVLILMGIMAVVGLIAISATITMLYQAAIKQEQARLQEAAQSQARLIEAIARFDKTYGFGYPDGTSEGTLSQIIDAHQHYRGFGTTGEFTLAKKDGDNIVFLLSHRHYDLNNPKPVSMQSAWAEPMKLALSGKSGTITGLDYRGEKVLAAYEPVAELDLGIVAKIDLSEIRKPFIKAGMISLLFGVVCILIGSILFIYITNPLLKQLSATVKDLEESLDKVRLLSGLLPICASCKKIRDDKGYWTQIESYISHRSEAEFTHSICPECSEKLYPQLHKKVIT
jgi:type II secretory pathway pseudopilin PulG